MPAKRKAARSARSKRDGEDPSGWIHSPSASQVTLHYPRIEHGLAGREQCLLCHESGLAGAPVVPATHAGRTNDTCQVCHKVGDD